MVFMVNSSPAHVTTGDTYCPTIAPGPATSPKGL
jgi:hypothetical protein